MTLRVVVLGAGVVGLTTAVSLAESPLDVEVRVDADTPPRLTTSAAAGATWDPYLAEPADLVHGWSLHTLATLSRLAAVEDSGVSMCEGTHQSLVARELPAWTEAVGARPCTPRELRPGYVMGWHYRAPLVDMPRYLDHLVRRLEKAGGRLAERHYASMEEALPEAPVLINCTGSGARSLVPDPQVQAARGQLVVVENPGIRDFFCDDTPGAEEPGAEELVYFYPHGAHVVLGGTLETGRWTTRPDRRAAAEIVRRCARIEPRLADARVLKHRVGLRPLRPTVRLGPERLGDTLVVHNYGHGGAGITLSWGCARQCADLVRRQARHAA
jgi:D-amino-acid oxidase